jgi:CheY-like chemotaxis protein
MPDEDGYDLIREVRTASGTLERVPAVAVTALAAGFQAHVTKPIQVPELIRVVTDLLAGKT